MSSNYSRIGILAIIALVCLRFLVGYHFFMEGLVKVKSGDFSSAGFLGASVGPLAPYFKSLLPDADGRVRSDVEALEQRFEEYGRLAAARYGFDEEQKEEAKAAVEQAKATLGSIFDEWRQDVIQYRGGLERREALQRDPSRVGVASLAAQRESIENEWQSKIRPVLTQVDGAMDLLTGAIAQLASPEQLEAAGGIVPFVLEERAVDNSVIDRIIPIFDMSVGILLMLGLLTPVAGIAAGLFLVSVVLTQFPGASGAQPTYYQAIEAAACFLLAFADAGRYAGLDFLPWAYWQRRRARKALRARQVTPPTQVAAA